MVSARGEHARNLGEVAAGGGGRGLVADTELECRRAPVDKLHCARVWIVPMALVTSLGVTSPRYSRRHAMNLPSLGSHLTISFPRLEAGKRELVQAVPLVASLVRADEGRVRGEREVNAREGDEVGLELVEVDIERATEPQRSRDRGDDLGNEPVQVL